MRIPPNPHPVIRIANTLATVAALLSIWLLLGLTSCATPKAERTTSGFPPNDREICGFHDAVARFAPTGPIPLTAPLAPMHKRTRWQV